MTSQISSSVRWSSQTGMAESHGVAAGGNPGPAFTDTPEKESFLIVWNNPRGLENLPVAG